MESENWSRIVEDIMKKDPCGYAVEAAQQFYFVDQLKSVIPVDAFYRSVRSLMRKTDEWRDIYALAEIAVKKFEEQVASDVAGDPDLKKKIILH